MNLNQLSHSIDSLDNRYGIRKTDIFKNLQPYFLFLRDTAGFSKGIAKAPSKNYSEADTSISPVLVYDNALNQARSMQSYMNGTNEDLESRRYQISKYKVEWHRKLSLSTACFLLFLIGAPMGAIIRKGGMGLPLVVSIGFFLIYHVTSITGEKFAKESIITPLAGMWMSSAILLPVGLFLIYKATHDSVLFDADAYKNLIKKIIKPFKR